MRQVPQYLIIGNGRVARHFQHFFTLLRLPFKIWHRGETPTKLQSWSEKASHILLLISDKAIEDFVEQHLEKTSALLVHFSGSLVSEKIFGAHPLMTFNQEMYDLERYLSIPFVIDDDAPSFNEILPGLPNQHTRLAKHLKAKYHALCVLSGNFSCLLWHKFLDSLKREFNIPHSFGHAYLQQQTQNLLTHYPSALTGPLVRNDTLTMESNLNALKDDPFQKIYKSFISCYQQLKEQELI